MRLYPKRQVCSSRTGRHDIDEGFAPVGEPVARPAGKLVS
jgi:hypothetical protein